MWLFRTFSGEGPFFSGGKPRATATSKTGVGNFFDDIFGGGLDRFSQGAVSASCLVFLQSLSTLHHTAREKDAFHDLEHSGVEKLVDKFFRRRVYGVHALDFLPAGMMLRNLLDVLSFHRCLPALFRIKNNVRSLLAGSETHVGFYFDISEPFSFNSLLKFGHELLWA